MKQFSRFCISYLLAKSADVCSGFFFLGAVAGVFMIYREAGEKAGPGERGGLSCHRHPGVVLLALIPLGFYTGRKASGPAALLLQLAGIYHRWAGPARISVSQMLYMLGIYETIIGNISSHISFP